MHQSDCHIVAKMKMSRILLHWQQYVGRSAVRRKPRSLLAEAALHTEANCASDIASSTLLVSPAHGHMQVALDAVVHVGSQRSTCGPLEAV